MAETQKSTLIARPPIVVVLGHVDHGKTSLLDAIRQTKVAAGETGGITQKIGASMVTTKQGKRITFIDTPGHAAFSAMRSRGAKVADIAVLVVAADDGVQPQTKEAIKHLKAAGVPPLVAITKIDLPSAEIETVLGQLEKEGLLLEKRGGDIPWVGVSAKTGQGIEELLDVISLLAEVKEIKADEQAPLEAVVIETSKEKGGCTINAVVRNGKLAVGETIYTAEGSCKIKNLLGATGPKQEVFPGEPVQILGFASPPSVGAKIFDQPPGRAEITSPAVKKIEVVEGEIGIFLKAANAGALEAILTNLPEKVAVIGSGVGDVFESDVLQAKASRAAIFAFESKAAAHIKKLAGAEGVKIYFFRVIYELFDQLKEILKQDEVSLLGRAEIVATFPFNNKQIAGCKVIQGKITKGSQLVLQRGEKELGRMKAVSLRKQKQEVSEVGQGEEFGLLFSPQLDFTMGDVILAVSQ